MECFSHLISTVRVKFLRWFLSYKHSSEDSTSVHCMKYLPSNGHKVTMGNARNIQWIAPNQSKTGGRFDLQRHGKEHTSNVGMSHGHSAPISHKGRANGHHWVSRCVFTNNIVELVDGGRCSKLSQSSYSGKGMFSQLFELLSANRPRTYRVRTHPFHRPKFKTERFENILSIAYSSILNIHIPNWNNTHNVALTYNI